MTRSAQISNILDENIGLIERGMNLYLPDQESLPPLIHEAMRYSALSGGKRLRPILVLEAARIFTSDYIQALPTAVAFELAHTFTLIHDDLPALDNDEFRRGVPTSHIKFGEDMAILAGDALMIEAFRLISTSQDPPEMRSKIVALLAEALSSNGVIGGQVADVLAERSRLPHNQCNLEYIHLHKTAILFKAAVLAGALLGGASEDNVHKLAEAALKIGLAFQIKDDILDIEEESEQLGKKGGKLTYPKIFGLEAANEIMNKLYSESIMLLSHVPGSERLAEIFKYLIDRGY